MEATELKARVRTQTGKGPARRFRKEGMIPAVFYGGGEEAIPLTVDAAALHKIVKTQKENVFIRLVIDGEKKLEKLSLIKELQIEPVSRQFYHADFFEVRMDQRLTLEVPLHFTGTPVGVENGGELQHLKRDLKISCLPSSVPEFIEVDVTGLEIGDSIKIQDIEVPEGVVVLDPGDVGVAMVAVVRVSVPEAEEAEQTEAEQTEAEGSPTPKAGGKT